MTVIIFLIVLAVLIFVHELGHFLVARACGIRVDEFALGFGPKIFSKTYTSAKHGITRYSLNLIPFGGYVKIFGENPDDESISGPDSSRSFVNKSRPVQAAVLAAGVFFNFIFAAIIFATVFTVGFPVAADGFPQYVDRIHDQKVVVTYVEAHSPAAEAGFLPGDRLIVVSSEAEQNMIYASEGKPLAITYERAGVSHTATVTPVTGIVPDKYAIGISMADAGILKLPVHLAVWEGIRYTGKVISDTAQGFWGLIAGIFYGNSPLAAISGPVGIAGLVGDAARLGFSYLLVFTALISVNLGVLNFVPFPALDGGRILFVIIESISRRRIKSTVANAINATGFGLLILLIVVVTYNDIAKKFF